MRTSFPSKLVAARYAAGPGVIGLVLFGGAGTLAWPAAWVFVSMLVAGGAFTLCVLAPRSPELIAERSRVQPGTKRWDRVLAPIAALTPMVVCATAALDRRLGWRPGVDARVSIASALVLAAGMALVYWAMYQNTYFAATVRIQHERGHRVISSGPYRLVRHPGYLGALLTFVALPLELGSPWAAVPGAAGVAFLVLRTWLEDRALTEELPGYTEFKTRTKRRLIPLLW